MVATAHLYIIGIGQLVCPSAWVANKDLALANGKIPCRVSQQSRGRVSNMNDAYAAGTVTGSVPGVGTVGRSASSRVRLMRSCNSLHSCLSRFSSSSLPHCFAITCCKVMISSSKCFCRSAWRPISLGMFSKVVCGNTAAAAKLGGNEPDIPHLYFKPLLPSTKKCCGQSCRQDGTRCVPTTASHCNSRWA